MDSEFAAGAQGQAYCSSRCLLFFSVQGKRVASEDGSEGYSDLYQENAMLQRESDTLRLRVKAMQETIDHLNTRVTHLLANEVSTLLTKSSM